jgi:hypothetical protein
MLNYINVNHLTMGMCLRARVNLKACYEMTFRGYFPSARKLHSQAPACMYVWYRPTLTKVSGNITHQQRYITKEKE